MVKRPKFPKTEEEKKEREAQGLWKAQALAKEVAESEETISLDCILRIHKRFFELANPDIAGRFRHDGQDIRKLKYIEPPPGTIVRDKMYEFARNFDVQIAVIPRRPKGQTRTQERKWLNQVLDLAAWTQYQITFIHPFCEGNGRMARILTNLVLRRFGLQPSDVKHEGTDRDRYIQALGQIDLYGDYDPLKHLIGTSMLKTYYLVKHRISGRS